jgi:predicted GH43/DUF377 family glycosyl hydrolase
MKIKRQKKANELFTRFDSNPILTPDMWPYPANAVMNPGATRMNNKTLLLVRVEDMRGFSHLTTAQSEDGLTNWQISEKPTLQAEAEQKEEMWGLEDARIIWLEQQRQFAITYTSFSEGGPVISLAITKNFRSFAKLGKMLPPEDKDACLFPELFKERFALIHRPIVRGQAHMWISFSPDLKHWGDHQLLVHTRQGYWDGERVGLACQPVKTEHGWLVFYHGVRRTTAGQLYRLGLVLLDLERPWKVLRRSAEWIFGPRAIYERLGDVGGVVFPSGVVVDAQNDTLFLYYGAADCTVGVAQAKFSDIIDYALSCPEVKE